MNDNDFVMDALFAEVKRLNAELQSEDAETEPDGKCREDDGCPTENAVLRREWRKLTEQLAAVTAERDTLKERTRWIPCSEQLPEKDGFYNVVMNGDRWGEPDVWSATSCGFYDGVWDEDGTTITHWMPLPEAPKEANHDE